MRSDLLQDLAPKSKTLEKLCDAFVDRADQVECITTFYEVNEMRGRMVSAHHHRTSTNVCDF